jgi:hypothetical protein
VLNEQIEELATYSDEKDELVAVLDERCKYFEN